MSNLSRPRSNAGHSLRQRLYLALLLTLVACSRAESGRPRPDVLFLVIDTLRADRLGAYGNERGLSPVMDQIAKEGTVFRAASAQAPWTLLSMGSMLTSQYPTEHFEQPSSDRTTIAEAFHEVGYATIGTVANSLLDPGTGFDRGFDVYIGREEESGRRKFPGYFDSAVSWVEESIVEAVKPGANGERKPLFLYLHPSDPHAPYREQSSFMREQSIETAPLFCLMAGRRKPWLSMGWLHLKMTLTGMALSGESNASATPMTMRCATPTKS